MDLDIRQSGTICTIKLKGRLISGDPVKQFDTAYQSALGDGYIYLVVNLEELPYIDSSGIGALVNALRVSSKVGGNTKLVKPSSFVAKTLKMCGLLGLFGVFETEAEAAAACGG